MNFIYSLVFIFTAIQSAQAKMISTDSQKIELEVKSATLELSVKCQGPKFEDDTFKIYFSDESYPEAQAFIDNGYSYRLVDKKCGSSGSGPQLSTKTFETATVYFVDGVTPRKDLEQFIKTIWESKK